MHYRLLDIQRQKVNNPLKVRSVITMCYNANKEIQKKLFKTVVSFSEEQVEAFKTIFEKGNIIKEEDVHGAYRGIKVYENKLIIKEITMWGDNTTVTLHEYNEDNLHIKSNKYKKNEELTNENVDEQTTLVYNSNKDLIKYEIVENPFHWLYKHTKFTIDSKWEYEPYKDNGKIKIKKTCYSELVSYYQDPVKGKWDPKYNKDKQVYEYDKEEQLIYYAKYDDKNNIIEIEENEYRGNLLVRRTMGGGKEEIRKYNEHEDVIYHKRYQTETTFKNGVTTNYILVIRNMEYKYDRYGNWIECRCYDENGDYSELFTRQIEYIE